MMKKLMLCLVSLLAISAAAYADEDTVTALVCAQTYQCTMGTELVCKPVNELQQQEVVLKKDGSVFRIADEARELDALIETSVTDGDMSYDITFCSKTVCTVSSSNGGAEGYINQTMFGQYNITEKTFYVLGFFITTQNKAANLKDLIQTKFGSFRR
jgi:hypothetical protein